MLRYSDFPKYANTPTLRIIQNDCYTPTDPDALAYVTAAGFTNCSLKLLIDDFFRDLKNTGEYSKISLMRLYLTDSTDNTTALNQCLINAVNPATYAPTVIANNPTANYSGVAYNGINQYHQCGYNPSTDAKWGLNSATFMGYYYLTATNSVLFGRRNNAIATNRLVYLQPLSISNVQINNGLNDSTAGVVFSPTAQNVSGFHAASRVAANTKHYIWKNNLITQAGVVAYGVPSMNMGFGAYSDDGGTTKLFVGAQRHQFDLFGSGIAPSQIVNLIEPLVNTLQANIDSLFGLTGTNARKRY